MRRLLLISLFCFTVALADGTRKVRVSWEHEPLSIPHTHNIYYCFGYPNETNKISTFDGANYKDINVPIDTHLNFNVTTVIEGDVEGEKSDVVFFDSTLKVEDVKLKIIPSSNNEVTIHFRAYGGYAFRMERSFDLKNWEPVYEIIEQDSRDVFLVRDDGKKCFYRIKAWAPD